MPPKPEPGLSPTLREQDANRREYSPLAPPLALIRNQPGDGWQPIQTCAVCGQHVNKIESWAPHMRRLHPYAPRSSKHGLKRVVGCDPTNALGDQTRQRDAYMSTPAFLRGLLAWVASNEGQSPLSVPDPAKFQDLITQGRDNLNDAKTRTEVDRHLLGIKIVEDTINEQANSAQPTLDTMVTALEGIYGQVAPLLSVQGTSENYSMISGAISTLSWFFREDSGGSNASEREQRDQSRYPTPPDSARKQPQYRPESSQSRRQTPHGPPNFRIARLIRNSDGAGGERASEVELQDPNFTVNFGDYLLHLDNDLHAFQPRFRNMAGQEGTVPRRMTQDIPLPWGLPTTIPVVADGIGIPIAFATEVMRRQAPQGVVNVARHEAFLVDYDHLGVLDQGAKQTVIFRNVISVGRSCVTIRQRALYQQYQYPWELKIDAEWLARRSRITRGEEEESEEEGSEEEEEEEAPKNPPVKPSNKPSESANKPLGHTSTSPGSSFSGGSSSRGSSHSGGGPPWGRGSRASNGSAAQFAASDLKRILDQDAATLTALLRRPTVRAHKRYQKAIGLLQTRRDEVMKNGISVDERRDRDRMRAAYRGLHDQIGEQLTLSDLIPYKEHDCHEIVSTIIEIVRRFEPEDTPLDPGDPDSLTDLYFECDEAIGGDGVNIIGSVNTGNITQANTNIYMSGRGIRSGKIHQTKPVMGKRSRKTGNSRPSGGGGGNDDDDDNGNGPPGAKRTKTTKPNLSYRKELNTKANGGAKNMEAYEKSKKAADAAKTKANGTGPKSSNVINLIKKIPKSNQNSKDDDYVPPGKSSKQTGPVKSTNSKPAAPKKPTTAKPKTTSAKPALPAKTIVTAKPVVTATPAILPKPKLFVPVNPTATGKPLVTSNSVLRKPKLGKLVTILKPVVTGTPTILPKPKLFVPVTQAAVAKPVVLPKSKLAVPAKPTSLKAPAKDATKKASPSKQDGSEATVTTTTTSKFFIEGNINTEFEKRMKAARISVLKKIDDMKKRLEIFPSTPNKSSKTNTDNLEERFQALPRPSSPKTPPSLPSPPKTSTKKKSTIPSPPASPIKRETRSETKRAADDEENGEVSPTNSSQVSDKRVRKSQRKN
jgi:hypothetical protein